MRKILVLAFVSCLLVGCGSTKGAQKIELYNDGGASGVTIDKVNYPYVDENTFGKKIAPDGNVVIQRKNTLKGSIVPSHYVIYKKTKDEGYYLDGYNSTCDVYGKIPIGSAYRDNFESGEYCILITTQTSPYDYFSPMYSMNASAVVLYVGDEYKNNQKEYINKNSFKFNDDGIRSEVVFLGDDEILDILIDFEKVNWFVMRFDLVTSVLKK